MSQTVANGNEHSNREISFMGGPKLSEEAEEDIGDTDDITSISEEGNTTMTKAATNFVSESMIMIGDTVSRLSKSFSTEKPVNSLLDDNIPMSSITSSQQNSETAKKCPKVQITSQHRRSQSVSSFTKIQTSTPTSLLRQNHGSKLRPSSSSKDETFYHEVWTWGKGHRGQHGHGDMLDRLQPSSISELMGLGVIKLACGKHHTIALTITGTYIPK